MHPEIAAVLNGESDWCLIHGDCREILPTLPDKCIDMVFTDPPYGIGWDNERNLARSPNGKIRTWGIAQCRDYGHYDWDMTPITDNDILLLTKISKEQCIWGGQYYAHTLPRSTFWLVWDKQTGDWSGSDAELAWCSHDRKSTRMITHKWAGFMQEKGKKEPLERFHPTQKPERVMKWALDLTSKEGQIILDPYAGSGSIGVAVLSMNRKYIGIELDERWIPRARQRLEAAHSQQRLTL